MREIRGRRIRLAATIAGILLVVGLIGLIVFQQTREKPGRTVSLQGTDHIEKGTQHVAYNTKPATSGPHWIIGGEAPVPWGIYKEPIPDEAQVHNLEHGGVMIQYDCDCPELAQRLEDFYSSYVPAHRIPMFPTSSKLVVAPYKGIEGGHRIALTAWGRIDTFDEYDEGRIVKFVEAYRDNTQVAPEAGRVP